MSPLLVRRIWFAERTARLFALLDFSLLADPAARPCARTAIYTGLLLLFLVLALTLFNARKKLPFLAAY